MIGYHAPKVGLLEAKGHPAFARIVPAGPWAYRELTGGGVLAYWASPTMAKPEDFGTPRPCPDGLIYYPAKSATLADFATGPLPDAEPVRLACGAVAPILPAYLEPRKILSNGDLGDAATAYGKAAWAAWDRWKELKDSGVELINTTEPVFFRLCKLALLAAFPRMTDEVWDDLGVLADTDVLPILSAAWSGPPKKVQPESEPSPSPSPRDASLTSLSP